MAVGADAQLIGIWKLIDQANGFSGPPVQTQKIALPVPMRVTGFTPIVVTDDHLASPLAGAREQGEGIIDLPLQ